MGGTWDCSMSGALDGTRGRTKGGTRGGASSTSSLKVVSMLSPSCLPIVSK